MHDISKVRRACPFPCRLTIRCVQRPGMFHEEIIERKIRNLVIKNFPHLGIDSCFCHQSCSVIDFFHAVHDFLDKTNCSGPNHDLSLRKAWHDICGSTASINDIVMNPHIIRYMFPQAFNSVKSKHHGIKAASPGFRFEGGMSGLTVISNCIFSICKTLDVCLRCRATVHHQGHI